MRWVAWVVVVSACAKSGGAVPTPAPSVSETAAAPLNAAGALPVSALPVSALPTLHSTPTVVATGNPPQSPKSKLCEVVVDGLTLLRPCTGAAGEKITGVAAPGVTRSNCLVKVGDLEIIRPCTGAPNERKAPTSKATPNPKRCARIEHTADGDIVRLTACPQ